ncbi:hypothetical protein GCM10028805_37580 [Spirosoma harenae]
MKFILCFLLTSVAFAQIPLPNQAVSQVHSDSSLRTQTTAQQYDFYYSAKQAERLTQMSAVGYTQEDRIKKKRFRDRIFTEFVLKGRKPDDGFDDYTLIGSGILADVNSNEEW